MKRSTAGALKIDVLVDSQRWEDPDAARAIVRRAVRQAAAALSTRPGELAIVLTDDAAMRRLNRDWRGIDAATNVLSFATIGAGRRMLDRVGGQSRERNQLVASHLGDVVLAYETLKREARRDGKSFDHHLAHLAVHGFLHLLGYDHESDAQARRMESAERAILRDLAVPDPYCDPHSTAERSSRPPKRAATNRAGSVRERRKIAAMLRPKMSNG
jgi:probable rRNA maturation factor